MQNAEQLYRRYQPSYNSAGGFLEETQQTTESLKSRILDKGPTFGKKQRLIHLSPPDSCMECGSSNSFNENSFLWQRFNYPVCNPCKENDKSDKYKLVARTEAKAVYGLKDCDLDQRKPVLCYISKKNPHNPRYGDMKLYLKIQLEQRMIEIYGSWENLKESKEQKEKARESLAEQRFERKLKHMRRELQRNDEPIKARHEHIYMNNEIRDSATGEYVKKCIECGYVMRFEKL